jgi:hypothetical protein
VKASKLPGRKLPVTLSPDYMALTSQKTVLFSIKVGGEIGYNAMNWTEMILS